MRFLVPLFTLFLAFTAPADQYQKPFGDLKDVQTFKDYTVRIYRNEKPPTDTDQNSDHQAGLGCFEILKSGKQVYFQKGVIFKVERVGNEGDTNNQVIFGQSINRDGQPNLIISSQTGCHCCEDYYSFEVGDRFRLIQKIETTIGGEFNDLRRDGELELVMSDSAFEYWHCGGAFNPYPTIILRYQNNKYGPDLELMRKPAPTEADLVAEADGFKSEFTQAQKGVLFDQWVAPYQLWTKMLDLIYTGNEDAAWRLCDLSWPLNQPGKAVFLKEFRKQLETSQYYNDICQPGFQGEAVHKN